LDDEYAPTPFWLRGLSTWLHPGFGFVAAVPSISQKLVTFTPNKPKTDETKAAVATYTGGLVVSVFDGAISYSIGRTLTGDRARTYRAVGISFLAATAKAKDLFKSLEQ
jgi:hypothetical protein